MVCALRRDDRVKIVYVVRGPAQRSVQRISAPTTTSTPIKKTIAIDCSITVVRNLKSSSERLVAALIMPPTVSLSARPIDGSKGPSSNEHFAPWPAGALRAILYLEGEFKSLAKALIATQSALS